MVGDVVVDAQTGREYVVTWSGGSLADHDPHYTRQRASAKDEMTANAIGPLGFRPTDVKCDVKVDWPW
jgi:hypothetical protein